MKKKELVGLTIVLRELREDFFQAYLMAFSELVREMLHVEKKQSELRYLQKRFEKQKKEQTLFFCIFDKETDRLIGAIEIRDQRETSSQLYSWLHEDFWGTGRYQEALRLASQEYFIRTNAPFFSAHVDADNRRSYYALKKQGFADVSVHKGPYGKQYELILRKK